MAWSDIIALLIVGVLLLVLFVLWERHLEEVHEEGGPLSQRWWTPPPLMPVSIWLRANGKLAAMLGITFLEWCSFNVFTFWVQVRFPVSAEGGVCVSLPSIHTHSAVFQLYYQDYLSLSPILTMVRLLPMSVTGVTCNVIIALVVGRVPLVYLVRTSLSPSSRPSPAHLLTPVLSPPLLVIGTLLTGASNLLFALINPSAPYWAFGFPAAIVTVFGADFVFATGTLFIARVCLPHEQSVGGALFQTLTQLGTAFGLAISTVVFNATLSSETTAALGGGDVGDPPREAQLTAYKDTMWAGFAFGMVGESLSPSLYP